MSEMEKIKQNIVSQLHNLCAHCSCGNINPHRCPIEEISIKVESLHGVPLIVNSQFKGVLFGNFR